MRGLPHSKSCFVCGEDNPDGFRKKFEVDEEGHVILRFNARKSMQGYGTVMHGGLQATLLDETMGWATAIALKRMTMAVEMTIRYKKRTPIGKDLIAEAWVATARSRLATAEGIIRDEEGTVYAEASGKFFPLSIEETKFVDAHLIYDEDDARVFEFPRNREVVEVPV